MGTREQTSENFERWRECRTLLDRRTTVLMNEMDAFLSGENPMPAELLSEVLELQKKCVALFEQLVKP